MIVKSDDRLEPGDELLGVGVYTVDEAAHYARVTTDMMKRWVYGSRRDKPVVRSEIDDDPDRIVTFTDFIQCIAVRQLRREKPEPSLQLIRKAYEYAVEYYDVSFPFALQHQSFYDGKAIWIKLPWREEDEGDDDEMLYTKVTGTQKGQAMPENLANLYANRITYDEESHRALSFVLYQDELGKIVMDPNRRFGEPLLPSGFDLYTVLDAYRSRKNIASVADSYGIDPNEVTLARRCDDFLDFRLTKAA